LGNDAHIAAAGKGHRRAVGEGTGPDLQTAEIEQDRDVLADLLGGGADVLDQAGSFLFAAVGGIDAHHVGAGGDEIDQFVLAGNRGAKGGHDLDATLRCHPGPPYGVTQPICRNPT
jgi:hypothetical protein